MDLLKTVINLLCIAFGVGVAVYLVVSSRKALKKAEAEARAILNNEKQKEIIREHLAQNKQKYETDASNLEQSHASVSHLLEPEPEPARPSEPSEFRKNLQ